MFYLLIACLRGLSTFSYECDLTSVPCFIRLLLDIFPTWYTWHKTGQSGFHLFNLMQSWSSNIHLHKKFESCLNIVTLWLGTASATCIICYWIFSFVSKNLHTAVGLYYIPYAYKTHSLFFIHCLKLLFN